MKKIIVLVIILAIIGLGTWRTIQVLNARSEALEETEKQPNTVEVEEIKSESIQEDLFLVGNIVADSEVTVLPEVAGKAMEIYVDEGTKVSKEQVIAKIEDKTLKLQVQQAEAAVEAAKAVLNQAKSLSEIKVRAQVAQAEAGVASAEAALNQVKDLAKTRTLSQMEQAEAGLAAIKANLKKIKDGTREEEKKQIEATVEQAQANLNNAEADLERIENLYEENAVSKQTLDATRTRAKVARAQYEAAKQQMMLVEKGARDEDILAMESQVKQAEAGLELAKSMFETKSWEKDIQMATAQYNIAKAGLKTAKALEEAKSWEAEIIGAETGLKQAQTALDLAKEALSKATITAPIAGIVSKRFLDKGNMVSPAAPLFKIVNIDKVKVVVNVIEEDLGKVSANSKAFISVKAYPEDIVGKVTMISPTLKPTSRTATVELSVDNQSHKLKPGMFAEVTIPVKTNENTIIIRHSAVIENRTSGEKYVFVVENNIAKKREVKTGLVRSDVIEILSGIKVGEKIVVSGQNYLSDGEQVRIVNSSK